MLKANIINESLDNMMRNIINESKLNEDNDLRDGVEDELRSVLMDTVSSLIEDRIINLKQYEIALQDAIEKVFPDLSWWEVTSTNIFMDLFEKRDPWAVVDDIMDTLTITDDQSSDQEYEPELTSDDMNSGQWYESLKEETEDKVELATKTKDQKLLAKLANDPDKNVREVVAMRVNDKKILNKLSGDESWLVRKEVARRGIPEILSKLVNDKNPSVREAVAIKTKDPEILLKLAKDKDRSVISAIMSNKSVTNKIIDAINDSTLSGKNESLKESKKLDEKVPSDLIKSIRADDNSRRWRSVHKNPDRQFNRGDRWSGNGVVDYENSNYRILSPQEVLGMKKRGEDLSNIYVIKNGEHIKLNRDGSPSNHAMRDIRSNQSLKKTLDGASKIYLADEKLVKDSQPEKFASRNADPEERYRNLELGAKGPYDNEDRYRKGMYSNSKSAKKAIARAKQDYEDGDISRKEMERIIANNKPNIDTYYGKNYQELRDKRADARNYAANKSARAKVDEYKELKSSIPDAEYTLKRAKQNLDDFNNGLSTRTYSDYDYNKRSAERYRKEIEDLEKKLKSARDSLEYYESKLTDDAKSSELKSLEDNLAKANDDLEAKTARLKALLRKDEALKRASGSKKLSEGKDPSDRMYNQYRKGQAALSDPNFNHLHRKLKAEVDDYLTQNPYEWWDDESGKASTPEVRFRPSKELKGKAKELGYAIKKNRSKYVPDYEWYVEPSYNEALKGTDKSKKLSEAKRDLSKIDGTVSNAVQKNLDRFGSCETVADIVKLLKTIFKEEGIDNESSRTVINKVSQSRTPNSAVEFLMSFWWGGVTYDTNKKKK